MKEEGSFARVGVEKSRLLLLLDLEPLEEEEEEEEMQEEEGVAG